MSAARIAQRYAKPILELAEEKKALDAVKADMEGFVNVCRESKSFALMLNSPIIPHLKKAEILNAAFKGKMNALTLQSFDLITRKSREGVLKEVAEEFLRLYNIKKGLQEVSVTSSIKLSSDQVKEIEKIAKKITGKKPIIKEKIDSEIIGGYVLKVGDKQVDQSVSGQLKNIKLTLQTK